MSTTVQPAKFNDTVGNIKQSVEAATAAQSHASERVWQSGKEFAAFNRSVLQAYLEAGQIYAHGSQDLFRQVAESTQAAFLETLNNIRAVAAAKTVKERIELQANFVRSTALRTVAENNRFANAGIDLAEKVAAPITTVTITAAESSTTFSKV